MARMENVAHFRWSATERQHVARMQLYIRRFSNDLAVSESARRLSDSRVFTQMLLAPGQIQLSGIDSEWHWVGQLTAVKDGTAGYVSALKLPTFSLMAQTHKPASFQFVPTGAMPLLDSAVDMHSTRMHQNFWHVDMSSDVLRAYLQQRLRGNGWTRDSVLSAAAGDAWQKPNETLLLLPYGQGTGSLLYHSTSLNSSAGN